MSLLSLKIARWTQAALAEPVNLSACGLVADETASRS